MSSMHREVLVLVAVCAAGCNALTGAGDLQLGSDGSGAASAASGATTSGSGAGTTGSSAMSTTSGSGGGAVAASSGSSTSTSTSTSTSGGTDPYQLCVDDINMFRATLGLPPYARWSAEESCVDMEAQKDAQSGTPHSAFGSCSESAQNECPGWPGPPDSMIGPCLQKMWDEGPGTDFSTHGHYINMTSTQYTKVACGYYTQSDGSVWATQDFQ